MFPTCQQLRRALIPLALLCLSTFHGLAQRPPNDDFTNRITLTGTSLTFSGSTDGATVEYNEPNSICDDYYYVHSIWWSWTAESSSGVIIDKSGSYSEVHAGLAVYNGTNIHGYSIPIAVVNLRDLAPHCAITTQAGTTYSIRLVGYAYSPVTFRLTVTNAPQIRVQPRTQTISTNGCALLATYAIGSKPIHYQWQHNGIDVPNATNAMLPFYAVAQTDAGEYRAVITNVWGACTTAVAKLFIATNDIQPVVTATAGPTNFQFTVNGEEGRLYRLESSTNLVNWLTNDQPVLLNTNVTTLFQIEKSDPRKFFRLSQYHAPNEICILNQKQINFAIYQWAQDFHMRPQSSVTTGDIRIYLNNEYILRYMNYSEGPVCPSSGSGSSAVADYGLTVVQDGTMCVTLQDQHLLEEPWRFLEP